MAKVLNRITIGTLLERDERYPNRGWTGRFGVSTRRAAETFNPKKTIGRTRSGCRPTSLSLIPSYTFVCSELWLIWLSPKEFVRGSLSLAISILSRGPFSSPQTTLTNAPHQAKCSEAGVPVHCLDATYSHMNSDLLLMRAIVFHFCLQICLHTTKNSHRRSGITSAGRQPLPAWEVPSLSGGVVKQFIQVTTGLHGAKH